MSLRTRLRPGVARSLEKAGYLVRDPEREYLDLLPDEDDAMNAIVGASITYRLAFGSNAGKKAMTLQTVPARISEIKPNELVSRQSSFSLHAGVAGNSSRAAQASVRRSSGCAAT